jgi:hypothetical chaperone protein
MAAPIGYGIDFGTSNSAVAVAYSGGIEVLPIDGAPTLPSQVYLHRAGRELAGEQAVRTFLQSGHERTLCEHCALAPYGWDTDCRQYRPAGGCNDARLLAGVKYELPKHGFTGTNSWAKDFGVPELVAVVLRRLKREADRHTGHDVRRLVLGHPVVFAGLSDEGAPLGRREAEAGEATAIGRLQEAARAAGFEEVELLPEPAAALLGEERDGQLELAVDFGGGTFDAAVMDGRGGPPRVTGLAGAPIGGEVLDGVLFEARIAPALALDALPNWLANAMRTASSARLLLADPGLPSILARVGGRAARIARHILLEGHAYDFYRGIERAKIALSSRDEVSIVDPPVGLDLRVRRTAFDAMIAPELDVVFVAIAEALEKANVTAAQVDRVLLTGGSSQIPAFRARLVEHFGEERLERRDAFTAVAHGLGAYARQTWLAAA